MANDSTHIALTRRYPFIAGHLFTNIVATKPYRIVKRRAGSFLIIDGANKEIWISVTARLKHFTLYTK